MTIDRIVRELASVRFEFVHRKAQRQPFQLFDRYARETVARETLALLATSSRVTFSLMGRE
jgi:hypothetical protein